MHGLREYSSDVHLKPLESSGLDPSQVGGPILTPIIRPDGKKPLDSVERCGCHPDFPTRGCEGFFATPSGGIVSVAAISGGIAKPVLITSFTCPSGHEAILQAVGIQVVPLGDFANITFQLAIGNMPVPGWSQNSFYNGQLQYPKKFYLEIPSGRTLNLYALNSAAVAENVTAELQGFIRPLSTV